MLIYSSPNFNIFFAIFYIRISFWRRWLYCKVMVHYFMIRFNCILMFMH